MARVGLGQGWNCLFANDVDPDKAAAYRANFGAEDFRHADICALTAADLPGRADLMWGSFPCQDLSLAGAGAGLKGARSATFYQFWRLLEELDAERRAPPLVALENVTGALTSHGGDDFRAICARFGARGYRVGALVIDAGLFTPQSRPRLFIIGARGLDQTALMAAGPQPAFHPPALQRAVEPLPPSVLAHWAWWRLPAPAPRALRLEDLLETELDTAAWSEPAATARLLDLMSPAHRERVEAAKASGRRRVGTVYRRTRTDGAGTKVQRAEVRFDDLAGCLRTPAGGSSRQMLLVIEGEAVRSRLLTPRETARLMGLPDDYRLPTGATAAYHLTGDGVAAPVVAHLARHLFEPLLGLADMPRLAA
jgi:DNA (cytosine-5)-methyltransferase 1